MRLHPLHVGQKLHVDMKVAFPPRAVGSRYHQHLLLLLLNISDNSGMIGCYHQLARLYGKEKCPKGLSLTLRYGISQQIQRDSVQHEPLIKKYGFNSRSCCLCSQKPSRYLEYLSGISIKMDFTSCLRQWSHEVFCYELQ